MIKVAAMSKNAELAEKYFQKACQGIDHINLEFLPNKFFYTSLIQAYVKSNNPYMGLKIVDEMKEKGIEPDLSTYTTLINCFRIGRNLQKCWEVNR